jgi:lysyl-tRNA synthetase class 2
MKRLLAQGFERLFQVCKAYRFEPKSQTHNPEFTILEWYRANSGFEAIMDDVENLFVAIGNRVHGSSQFETEAYGKQDVSRPWLRLSVEECFRRFAGLELSSLLTPEKLVRACVEKGYVGADALHGEALAQPGVWDDLFFRVMMNDVEPGLAKLGRPVIVHLYPESQAALSNIHTDSRGLRWAKRFEVYAGGLELGNAFDELTDPVLQRKRFEKDMELRNRLYGDSFPVNPIDEEFLAALKKMPASGGIAMGVDRIAMYFSGAREISEVLWLPSYV